MEGLTQQVCSCALDFDADVNGREAQILSALWYLLVPVMLAVSLNPHGSVPKQVLFVPH